MPKLIHKYKSDSGGIFDSEMEALKDEVAFYKKLYQECKTRLDCIRRDEPQSSYGSSGGGGHD